MTPTEKPLPMPDAWKPFAKPPEGGAPATPAPLSLIAKLADIMAAVERIAKRGHNDHFHYDFATESDITAAIRKEMASRHLMLVPHVESLSWRQVQTRNGVNDICCALVEFTVHDGETGDCLKFRIPGEGQDSGDKCVPKALTSALKYALLKLFMIPTGDDPERTPASAKPPTRTTQKRDAKQTPDPPTTVVNTQTGEDVPVGKAPTPPEGYHYITGYSFKNGWHEMTLPNFDLQGGPLKISTKLVKVGEAAKQAYQLGVPVKVDVTMKHDSPGEAYLNKVDVWSAESF